MLGKWGAKGLLKWIARFLRVVAIAATVATATAQEPEPEPEPPLEIPAATVQCFGLGMIIGFLAWSTVARNVSL